MGGGGVSHVHKAGGLLYTKRTERGSTKSHRDRVLV